MSLNSRCGRGILTVCLVFQATYIAPAFARPAPRVTEIAVAVIPTPPVTRVPVPPTMVPATVTPEVCLSDEAFNRAVQELLAEEAPSMVPQSEQCQASGGIDELGWELSDEQGSVLRTGSVTQERNVPTSIEQLSSEDVGEQCAAPVAALPVEVALVQASANELVADETPVTSQEPLPLPQDPKRPAAPPSSTRPPSEPLPLPLPPINEPLPLPLPPVSGGLLPLPLPPVSQEPQDEVRCCSYGYSPDDGRSPGGDNFCAPHAEQFDWTAANCDHIINCRLRFDPAAPSGWSFRDCFDRQSRERMGTLKEVYEKLKCTTIRHVTLHHSNPQWGPKDCQAHVACLPTGPGRDIDVIHNQLGCSTFGSPALRCARAQRLVELFKQKCDTHGRVRLVVTGKQTDLWIPAGRNLDCSWKNPTGHCYFTNAPKMRKLVITPDGFVSCRLVQGKWVEYPEYCQGTGQGYPGNKTGDPDRPDDLRC